MRACGIIESEVVGKDEASIGKSGEFVEIHTLVFDRPPQSLGEDVVHTSAATVHRDSYVFCLEQINVLWRGEVRPLVGVVYGWRSTLQCGSDVVETERNLQCRGELPVHHVAGGPVADGNEGAEG